MIKYNAIKAILQNGMTESDKKLIRFAMAEKSNKAMAKDLRIVYSNEMADYMTRLYRQDKKKFAKIIDLGLKYFEENDSEPSKSNKKKK